jgi:hypothetical protein
MLQRAIIERKQQPYALFDGQGAKLFSALKKQLIIKPWAARAQYRHGLAEVNSDTTGAKDYRQEPQR